MQLREEFIKSNPTFLGFEINTLKDQASTLVSVLGGLAAYAGGSGLTGAFEVAAACKLIVGNFREAMRCDFI
jgi:hypothetical protein